MSAQLCQLASDFTGEVLRGGMMCEEKFDGLRAMYFPGIDGVQRLWSRNGIAIEGTGHIRHRLAHMERVAGQRLFIDGEFVVDGTLVASKAWFERGWKSGGEAGVFHVFDLMPFADWRRGGSDMPQNARKRWLADLLGVVDADPALSWDWRPGSHGLDEAAPPVVLLPDEWSFTAEDAMDMAQRVWARGGEGCVLKDPDASYVRGRNRSWLKLKDSGAISTDTCHSEGRAVAMRNSVAA